MDRRAWFRGLAALGIIAGLIGVPAFPAAARGTCKLAVEGSPVLGQSIALVGSDFPVSTTVDVSTTHNETKDMFAAQSDAGGRFRIELTLEASDIGTTVVMASVAGTPCAAQASFTVAPATTPKPAATASPSPVATPTPSLRITPAPTVRVTPAPSMSAAVVNSTSTIVASGTPLSASEGSAGSMPPTDATDFGRGSGRVPGMPLIVSGLLLLGVAVMLDTARRGRGRRMVIVSSASTVRSGPSRPSVAVVMAPGFAPAISRPAIHLAATEARAKPVAAKQVRPMSELRGHVAVLLALAGAVLSLIVILRRGRWRGRS